MAVVATFRNLPGRRCNPLSYRDQLPLPTKVTVNLRSEWFLVESQLEQVDGLLSLYAELKQGSKPAEVIQRFAVVTFHQSYSYEGFIEGIRARSDENGNISYPIEPGIFMPVKNALDAGDEEAAIKQLKIAFQKKIIPLLQEYFFDDWSKIRLVLADNQKKDDSLQFVIENTDDLDNLSSG